MKTKWIGASTDNYMTGRNGRIVSRIVLHWMVGTLESTDVTFQNPDRIASAHFGIGNNNVHQYVKEEDTAYHAGNWDMNLKSIGIEHEGGWLIADGKVRFKPTIETHNKSVELITELCRKYNIPADREHILKHSEVSDRGTECSGSLDINKIVKEVKASLTGEIISPIRQLVTDILLALKKSTSENEIDAWEKKFVNPKEMIEELMENDGKVYEVWTKSAIDEAILKCNENWQSQLNTANNQIVELNQTISGLENKEAESYHWKTLLRLSWRNLFKRR